MTNKQMEQVLRIIYQNISLQIKEQKLSVSEVEKQCGVSIGYISRIKNGHIGFEFFYKISKLLNVSLDDLCSEEFYKEIKANEIIRKIEELEKERKEIMGE